MAIVVKVEYKCSGCNKSMSVKANRKSHRGHSRYARRGSYIYLPNAFTIYSSDESSVQVDRGVRIDDDDDSDNSNMYCSVDCVMNELHKQVKKLKPENSKDDNED